MLTFVHLLWENESHFLSMVSLAVTTSDLTLGWEFFSVVIEISEGGNIGDSSELSSDEQPKMRINHQKW